MSGLILSYYILLYQLMLGSNREDDLLNKLKNCIGSLQKQNASITQMRNCRPTYTALKENYYAQKNAPKISSIPLSERTNKLDSNLNLQLRQPLSEVCSQIPLGRNSVADTSRPYLPINKIKAENQIRPYTFKDEKINYGAEIRKFEYASTKGRREESQFRPIDELSKNKFSNQREADSRQSLSIRKPQQQIESRQRDQRIEVARRYSVIEDQKPTNRYTNENSTRSITAKNYQRQVQERRNLLQSQAHETRNQTPTKCRKQKNYLDKQRKDEAPTIRESNYPLTAKPTQKGSAQDQSIVPLQQDRKKPTVMRQQLLKSYQQNNEAAAECSALGKLKKISELNQKINERIRNIINVFEEHKC